MTGIFIFSVNAVSGYFITIWNIDVKTVEFRQLYCVLSLCF